jgi:23S rRNA (adenine2503-C2)-methyltransferase
MDKKVVYLLDLDLAGLKELVISLGEKAYRAGQLAQWIYKKSAASFDEMSDLPQGFRAKLQEAAVLFSMIPLEDRVSSDGRTRKILFQLEDGQTLESTLMFYENTTSHRERLTVCISTQVGCPVGCYFCATGQQGFVRNLRPGEILEQVLYFVR